MTAALPAIEAGAVRIAADAGACALRIFGSLDRADVGFKGRRDLVTRGDLEVETLIVERLRREFPSHHILAEEAVSDAAAIAVHDAGQRPPSRARDLAPLARALEQNRCCWFIDPIDGTTNFAHRHPFFAISMGLYVDGRPALGIVHAPALGEMYVARAGAGATLNGRALRVSTERDLGDAVFATGFPYRRNELSALENNIEHFHRFILDVRDMRRGGSAAIDLAFVAAGRFGFYFEAQLEPWDVAAGALLVAEAGGTVSDYSGGGDWLFGRQIVASNGPLHPAVRERLAPDWRPSR